MRSFLLAALLLIPSISIFAQTNKSLHTGEILSGLEKLNKVGAVLYVAAHPDDENTRLLAYLANERKLRTGYLSLTRGDGGQNLIGKEQAELLGLIRTQELLAARRTDGAEQFFTRANDFGFSKNPEETFSIWNKEQVLGDVVWTIRKFRPDVIICRFPTTGEGGHGHHTASAILAQEAFDAAADANRFPEQLKYVSVWKTKRLFWNTFNFGGLNTTAANQVKIDVGGFNPLLGQSYGEIAADSRSFHKSQGFGSAKTRGESLEYFKQLKGDSVNQDIFEDIDQTWDRMGATAGFQTTINNILKKYNSLKPEGIVPDLAALYQQIAALDDSKPSIKYWKQQKLKETEALLLACSGLWMEATANTYSGIPGYEATMTASIINKNPGTAKLNKISFPANDTNISLALTPDVLYSFPHKEMIANSTPLSTPYWLTEHHPIGAYVVNNPLLIGNAENQPALDIVFDVTIAGVDLKVKRGIVYKYTDPVKGEVYRPYEILPPATVNFSDKEYVWSGNQPKPFSITIKANKDNVSGRAKVLITVKDGWNVRFPNTEFNLKTKGDEVVLTGEIIKGTGSFAGLQAQLEIDGQTFDKSIRRIEYDHIPYQFILSDATASAVNIDLKKAGTNIGYIPGAGDDVAACLKQVGYKVTTLTEDLLATTDLSKYDAIISGVRAYNINEHLQAHYNKLMNYVKNGGNLVVQYNTNSRVGPLAAKIGPYPFTVSRDRVTDEKATMNVTNPKHPVLNYPNKITNNDFNDWVQERGIYFATEVDKNYETVFSINDMNEKPSDGSLIIAKYGKGNFAYTGIVFFRQLPAGNPGAYRLFVNLLSLPANK